MTIVPNQQRKINVLVVEDVMIAQRIAVIIFGQHNCAVVTANNGKNALEAVEKQEFDFILMDLGLPDTDGITLTKTLRQKGGWLEQVPIVAMTAHTDESFKDAAVAAGITDFYTKPITGLVARTILEKLPLGTREAAPTESLNKAGA